MSLTQMAKRRTWLLGTAGLLVGAGVIVVIVLAALGYFNKKGGGGGGGTSILPINTMGTTGSLVTPGTVGITNLQDLGWGVGFKVNDPCTLGMFNILPNCKSTLNTTFKYQDGTTKALTTDITGFISNAISYLYGCNGPTGGDPSCGVGGQWEKPVSLELSAYSSIGGIPGPTTGPIPWAVKYVN